MTDDAEIDADAAKFLTRGLVASHRLLHLPKIPPKARSLFVSKLADFDLFDPVREWPRRKRKMRVLFLGPIGFRPGVWDTRYKYIFPDVLDALVPAAEFRFLCGPIPDWAQEGMQYLKDRYELTVEVIGDRKEGVQVHEHWAVEATRVAQDFRADVITNVFAGSTFGFAGGVAARANGIRMVLRIAGDEISNRLDIGIYEPGTPHHEEDLYAESLGFNLSDAIVVMSEQERRRVQSRLVVRKDRVKVCTRGVDVDIFKPREGFDEEKPRRIFAYVGRKSLEKGYDLIEASADIVAKSAPDISFRFAGTFEPGSDGNREYMGFVQAEDLTAYYASADAFILCSRNEGFPQAVAEAMAMGLPCILSRHIFGDTLEDEQDALLVELDATSIARAIRRLADDPQLAARLAKRSRQIACKRFVKGEQSALYRDTVLGIRQRAK